MSSGFAWPGCDDEPYDANKGDKKGGLINSK